MVLDSLARLISDKEPKPNKFSIAMGEKVKTAREEAGLSQADLASKIYRRRATISDFETGKSEVDATTLLLLSAALNKPISYFFPKIARFSLPTENEDPLEQELLAFFREISGEHLQKVAVDLVRVLSKFDPETMLPGLIERSKK